MNRFEKNYGVAIVRGFRLALCSAALLFVTQAPALAQSTRTHHIRQAVSRGQAKFLNLLPGAQSMRLDIVLPLSDPAGLDKFLQDLYNPASPSYRHFLSVSEFTARFGPSQEDYDAVIRYATSNGLRVVGGSRDGMDVQVEGTVTVVEKALNISMGVYQHPTENRTFYAPDREPTLSLPFALWHISGLDNFSIPRPMLANRNDYAKAHGIDPETVVSHATTGTGPSASFLGSDMRAAYYGGTALTGAGQNLGLLEYLGTDLADLTTYFNNVGQTNHVPVTLFSTDGTSTSCVHSKAGRRCDDIEQTLDMTQAIGMAPGLDSLVVYVGSTDTAIISAMTTHSPLPTTIGCSWGWTPADPSALDPYFQRMAAQGQTFLVASGDNSTWTATGAAESWPADDAYVVSVGGTDLVTASAGGPWLSETAWVDSGGGISPNKIPIPSWQQIAGVTTNGSAIYRNGPDVSANADFTFYVCGNQTTCTANLYGGTSFAAPMWAGYLALVNQQAAANHDPPVGFINPAVYSIGAGNSGKYSTDFHDITSGTSGSYSAGAAFDLVTGWGSPTPSLVNDLLATSPSDNFGISAAPNSVSVVQGGNGSSTITTTISGNFNSAIALSASGQPTGVTIAFTPTSIAAPGSGSSTMSIVVASTVAPGPYSITVTASAGALTHTTAVSLTVTAGANPTFSISASPTQVIVVRGGNPVTSAINTVSSGFSSGIALSATGQPGGVTVSFNPATVSSPGTSSSTMTITASRGGSGGNYTITITGTGGGITHTTTVSLAVQK